MAETEEKKVTVTIKASDLIAKFQKALADKYGYIWGKVHEMWTQAKQDAYAKAYKDNPDRANSCKYGGKWVGHYVTDCSGLFTWAFQELGGYMYHGSNTMWNSYCAAKGELRSGKREDGKELKPGTAVFTYNKTKKNRGHVGLYVGDGTVIEAKGAQYGVVTSKVTDAKWVEWGELKGVDFDGVQPEPTPTPTPTPTPEPANGEAIVTGKQVALRKGPSTTADVITRVATGETVKIAKPPSDWEYVTYNGKSGYMMKQFLKEG